MTITQIQYFLTVAEELSFTRASEQLYVSQQAVSRQIQLLEEELGFALFIRNNRRIELTEAGRRLFRLWKRQQSESREALRIIRSEILSESRLQIGIADLNQIVDEFLPALLDMRENPSDAIGMNWEYRIATLAAIEQGLAGGTLDLVMTLLSDLPPGFPSSRFTMLRLIQQEVFLAKSHPLYSFRPRNLPELRAALQTLETAPGDTDDVAGTFLMMESSFSTDGATGTLSRLSEAGIRPETIRWFSNPDELELELITGKGLLVGYKICLHAKYVPSLWSFPADFPDGPIQSALVLAWREPEMKSYAQHILSRL